MGAVRRLLLALTGAAAALLMVSAAGAQQSRVLGAGDDFWRVTLLTAIVIGALLAVAAIGYLYRRERGLNWEFQRPDPDEQHEGDA